MTGRATHGTILIVFRILLNAPPLAAADSEMTQEYLTCMDKSKGNTAEMTDCIRAETARQDARLNENYKRLMSKLSAKRKNTARGAARLGQIPGSELQLLFRPRRRHSRASGRQGLFSAGDSRACKRTEKPHAMMNEPKLAVASKKSRLRRSTMPPDCRRGLGQAGTLGCR